jgi:hypothetical protein
VIVATVLTLISHIMLAFSFASPYGCMVGWGVSSWRACVVSPLTTVGAPQAVMGIGYSVLASSLWPMVSYTVPEHQLGTAYGMYVRGRVAACECTPSAHVRASASMQAVQNLGLAVVAIVAGSIVDTKV